MLPATSTPGTSTPSRSTRISGEDSLAPFLSRRDRGVIVVCKTSNPGSADLQNLGWTRTSGRQPLYLTVADRVAAWAERWPATLGLVVGATYPAELAEVRRRCPDAPILLPGIGAQAGDLEASLRAGLDSRGLGLIVSSSRSVIYAGKDRRGRLDRGRACRCPATFARPSMAFGLPKSERTCPAGALRAWGKQPFPHHQIYGQGAVTDGVEEDDHGVARVAHDQPRTPDFVHDLAIDRERLG